MAKLEAELDATRDFYARKVMTAEARAEFHTKNLGNFAKQQGKSKIATPLGTVFFKSTTKRTWPKDPQVLIDFAKSEGVAERLIKITESPNKPAILKYIKASGSLPDGFKEERTEPVACVILCGQTQGEVEQGAA